MQKAPSQVKLSFLTTTGHRPGECLHHHHPGPCLQLGGLRQREGVHLPTSSLDLLCRYRIFPTYRPLSTLNVAEKNQEDCLSRAPCLTYRFYPGNSEGD